MKTSISLSLSLTDEELVELQRIVWDGDEKEALRFLQKHLKDKARQALHREGHCKPWFELHPGMLVVPGRFELPDNNPVFVAERDWGAMPAWEVGRLS